MRIHTRGGGGGIRQSLKGLSKSWWSGPWDWVIEAWARPRGIKERDFLRELNFIW